jgi:hypothetical protein
VVGLIKFLTADEAGRQLFFGHFVVYVLFNKSKSIFLKKQLFKIFLRTQKRSLFQLNNKK